MNRRFFVLRRGFFAVLACGLLSACNGGSSAVSPGAALPLTGYQSQTQAAVRQVFARIQPSDRRAAAHAKDFFYHVMWRNGLKHHAVVPSTANFPGTLVNHGGPTMRAATQRLVFINCDAGTCWANPTQFLTDLNRDAMIDLTDQYVGSSTLLRYPLSTGAKLDGTLAHTLFTSDINTIVHAAVNAISGHPAGYTNEYHLFFKSGQDICFTGSSTNECYSPDVPSTFYFCAYHSSVNFNDFGHVIYSVEPYQNVSGCNFTSPTPPNGSLADATYSTLSHELFESITDPDGNAYWNSQYRPLNGQEIGDECQAYRIPKVLNGRNYALQQEYSNLNNACMP